MRRMVVDLGLVNAQKIGRNHFDLPFELASTGPVTSECAIDPLPDCLRQSGNPGRRLGRSDVAEESQAHLHSGALKNRAQWKGIRL